MQSSEITAMIDYAINEQEFVTHYCLPHPKFTKVPTFHWYEAPAFGVGKRSEPIVALDKYLQPHEEMLDDVYSELMQNKSVLEPHLKGLVVNGIVHEKYNNYLHSIDEILLTRDDKWEDYHRLAIKDYEHLSQIKSHFYRHYHTPEFWRGIVHLREYTNFANKAKPSNWLPYSEHFPKLVEFIETLPFKQLGYALFFVSKKNTPVYIHRDTYIRNHHVSNFINIMFDRKPKPTFVFDSMSEKRYYLSPHSSFYTFNEADLHGVDPEPEERWMLRVEGLFSDWFAEELGIENHEVFNWSYRSGQAFVRNHPNGIRIQKRL